MRKQCELLDVARSSVDYEPVAESEEDRTEWNEKAKEVNAAASSAASSPQGSDTELDVLEAAQRMSRNDDALTKLLADYDEAMRQRGPLAKYDVALAGGNSRGGRFARVSAASRP